MKLAVFDVDSTLIDAETIERLASVVGLEDKVREVTTRAMQGELDFFESLLSEIKFSGNVKATMYFTSCKSNKRFFKIN